MRNSYIPTLLVNTLSEQHSPSAQACCPSTVNISGSQFCGADKKSCWIGWGRGVIECITDLGLKEAKDLVVKTPSVRKKKMFQSKERR